MKLISALMILISMNFAHAATSERCMELKSEQQRLSLISSNITNTNTTRTTEGGPYKTIVIKSCNDGACEFERSNLTLMKYEPDHPDANENGYVAYPEMDLKKEQTALDLSVLKIKLLAKERACDSELIADQSISGFMVKYGPKLPTEVKQDIFNLKDQREIISWMRESKSGVAETINLRRE